jgi:hypothetical protein
MQVGSIYITIGHYLVFSDSGKGAYDAGFASSPLTA